MYFCVWKEKIFATQDSTGWLRRCPGIIWDPEKSKDFPINVYTFTPLQLAPFSILYGRIGEALIIISAEMIRRSNRDRIPFPSINAGGLECLSQAGLSYGLWRAREKRGGGVSRQSANEEKLGKRKRERKLSLKAWFKWEQRKKKRYTYFWCHFATFIDFFFC